MVAPYAAALRSAAGTSAPPILIPVTNAIEALNSKLRRAVRTRGHFPGDDAAMKLLYLVLNQAAEEWKRAPREWFEAKVQFAVIFGERFSA
jgi:putative transposase